MLMCFRQSYGLPKKFVIFKRTTSIRLINAFSSIPGSFRSNTNKLIFRKLVCPKPRHYQPRCFSLHYVQAFYDSVGTSETCKFLRQILINTHDLTGFSWCFTIIASSIMLRLFVTLPCGIYQQYIASKLELLSEEVNTVAKNVKEKILLEAYKRKWTKEKCNTVLQQIVRQHWRNLIIKNNCHPFKIVVLYILQVPFWLTLTLAIRKLAMDATTGKLDSPVDAILFQVGGPFWSKNLTMPDPKFILPIINLLCFITTLEISFLTQPPNKLVKNSFKFYFSKINKYLLRFTGVAFFFISAAQPSAVSLFWASNSLLSVAQKFLIMSPKLRRFFRIPKTSSEMDKPYSQTWSKFLEKFTVKK